MHTRLAWVALPLLLAYGLALGLWTNRWHTSAPLQAATARLADVPLDVGDWQGQELELSPRQVTIAEIDGYLMRRYTHKPTGAALTVLLVCGRPGPVSVHTPDVCYGGMGYRPQKFPIRETLEVEGITKGKAAFWGATFAKADVAAPDRLAIRWSWNATGDWEGPDNPRWRYGSKAALYKLYVVRPLVESKGSAEDPATVFLRQFLPELEKALFPGEPS